MLVETHLIFCELWLCVITLFILALRQHLEIFQGELAQLLLYPGARAAPGELVWGVALVGNSVDISPTLQQERHQVRILQVHCEVEGCPAITWLLKPKAIRCLQHIWKFCCNKNMSSGYQGAWLAPPAGTKHSPEHWHQHPKTPDAPRCPDSHGWTLSADMCGLEEKAKSLTTPFNSHTWTRTSSLLFCGTVMSFEL